MALLRLPRSAELELLSRSLPLLKVHLPLPLPWAVWGTALHWSFHWVAGYKEVAEAAATIAQILPRSPARTPSEQRVAGAEDLVLVELLLKEAVESALWPMARASLCQQWWTPPQLVLM